MKYLETLLVLVVAVFAAIKGKKWKTIGPWERLSVVASISLAIAVAYDAYQKQKEENLDKKIKATVGSIKNIEGAVAPVMEIGYSNIAFTLGDDGIFGLRDSEALMRLYVKDNRLYISTVVREKNGDVIAVINDNEWEMVKNVYDYNNDDRAFEVVTKGDRKVVFHVELSGGLAHVAGMFYTEKGFGYYFEERKYKGPDDYIDKDRTILASPGTITIHFFAKDSHDTVPYSSTLPIFKYPRSAHLGERIKPFRPVKYKIEQDDLYFVR